MDTLLLITVGSLVTLVAAVAGWASFLAWHAGRLWAERRHREELASLQLQSRLAGERPDDGLVDLADRFGLLDQQEVVR